MRKVSAFRRPRRLVAGLVLVLGLLPQAAGVWAQEDLRVCLDEDGTVSLEPQASLCCAVAPGRTHAAEGDPEPRAGATLAARAHDRCSDFALSAIHPQLPPGTEVDAPKIDPPTESQFVVHVATAPAGRELLEGISGSGPPPDPIALRLRSVVLRF